MKDKGIIIKANLEKAVMDELASRVTKEEIIEIQTRQLEEWKMLLKRKAFKLLKEWATATNKETKDPFKIRRGTQLNEALYNIVLKALKK